MLVVEGTTQPVSRDDRASAHITRANGWPWLALVGQPYFVTCSAPASPEPGDTWYCSGTYMAVMDSWWWMSGVSGSSTGQRLPRVDERISALGREVVQYAVVDPAIQPPSEEQVPPGGIRA
jgi:hypothetical protein